MKDILRLHIKNDLNGIEIFLSQLDTSLHHCVLEATGNYGALLVEMLLAVDLSISVVNPMQIKHFAKVMQHITKTDKVDAELIFVVCLPAYTFDKKFGAQ